MLVITTKNELRTFRYSLKEGKTIGLVPTMGALHRGHFELVKTGFCENDVLVVSIFVNPTQFNNPDDLRKYPKTIERDTALLKEVSEEIVIFCPSVNEMYSDNIVSKTYDFEGLATVMEGVFRPNHFNGVGTIVEELLTLVAPNRAYFGEKDYQQLQIIRKLVEIKKISTTIIGCPVVRESSGLAMSSRNERLSDEEKKDAALIFKILQAAKIQFGTKSAKRVLEWVKNEFKRHPKLRLEYVEITTSDTLKPIIRKQKGKAYRAFISVYVQDVRLIDNIAL